MRFLTAFFIFIQLLSVNAWADIYSDAGELMGIKTISDCLDSEAAEVTGEMTLSGDYDTRGALRRVIEKMVSAVKKNVRSELAFFAQIVAIAVLNALVSSLCTGDRIADIADIASCCCAALLLISSSRAVFEETEAALFRLSDYSKATLPTMFLAASASGAVLSAPIKYSAACLGTDVLMTVSNSAILPLIYAYLAISVCNAMFPNPVLRTSSRLTKWCAVTLMTAVTMFFCAYMGFSGLLSGSADAATVKATKTVISTAIPVIGGIISDASATVLAAANVVKYSAGSFALLGVCAMLAAPFAMLSLKKLFLEAASAVAGVAGGRLETLLSGCTGALGMLLGVLGYNTIMVFISFVSAMKAVS